MTYEIIWISTGIIYGLAVVACFGWFIWKGTRKTPKHDEAWQNTPFVIHRRED